MDIIGYVEITHIVEYNWASQRGAFLFVYPRLNSWGIPMWRKNTLLAII